MKDIKRISRICALQDIVVVGAGPAGLIAGAEAARLGAEVQIFEEDREVGYPEHCAGLVSTTGVEALSKSTSFIIGWIKGAKIFSPSGKVSEIRSGVEKALVIDRPKFDKEMLRQAEAAGAQVQKGKAYESGTNCKVLIVAEGTKGRVGRSLGFKTPKSIPAVQIDIEAPDFERDMVELHPGRWAPGFFAWVVPRGDGVRVGLAAYEGVPFKLLERMLEKDEYFRVRVSGKKASKPIFGKVVVGGPLTEAVRGNAVAIGDAGGFVKPTTGGGVALGGAIAKMAGGAAASAALWGKPLGRFDDEWKAKYGREFRAMGLTAKVFRNMKCEEIERALDDMGRANLLDLMVGYDMDLQRSAVKRVLRSRLMKHAILPIIRSIF